ncbi:MAG: hypothetical protein JXA08_01965 [Methanomicrobiaceae archaeon]|nr:hypothetical protein [Methanomicrobiaceae archaeon]
MIAIIAVSIALYRAAMAIVAQRKQDRSATETPPGPPGKDTAETPTVRRGETADIVHATGAGMAQASSLVSAAYRLHYLTRETSLGRVILYLVIAEFGIFCPGQSQQLPRVRSCHFI